MMKRYVIGDIHGCYKQLFELVHHINRHVGSNPAPAANFFFRHK
jgi:hypothetical protein